MRFWQFLQFTAPGELVELPRITEQTPANGIMLGDHTIFPEKVESHHLDSKDGKSLWDTETGWPDVFTSVAAMARATERLRFSTKVVVLPLRWMAEGYATAGQMVGYDGQHFDFPRSAVSPRPYSRIPSTWLAVARRCSVRRTGQTGWIVGHFTADTIGPILAELRRCLAEAERDPAKCEIIASCRADLDAHKRLRTPGVSTIANLASRSVIEPGSSLTSEGDYIKRFAEEYKIPALG